ncbi:MAG: LysR family transcriptional regulator [Rhodospirillales bacterium]|nr:LysR family transcriptional regulator [Rhodospirillales bacterium]
MDSLSGMAVFTKVAERESFTGAATDLKLSKSAVSKQIARLEDRLGVQLIHRTTRKLHLTEVGRAFYERAKRVVEEAEAAEQAISSLHDSLRGTLRINSPLSFGIRKISPLLPEFMARHPDLKIDITFNDRQVDLIEDGFDMGVRIAQLTDSSLIVRKLGTTELVVAASPEYWKQNGKPDHPRDLVNHRCLLYDYRQNPHEWHFQDPDGPLTVRVDGHFRSNNGDALICAAVNGAGVHYVPTFLADELLVSGHLETALEPYTADGIGIYAVWPPNRHLSAKVRSFVDFLIDNLANG